MKTLRIIAAFLVIVMAAGMLAACGGAESAATEKAPETSFNFESIDGKDSETEPPVTETERETERDEATDAENEDKDDKEDKGDKDDKDADGEKNGIERSTYGETALAIAEELIGTKYKYGGEGPDTFDNSGFIYYIFKRAGTTVPRLATGMATFGYEVKRQDIKPGDVLVFANEIGGAPEFVGIYCGEGKFIACCNEDSPTDYQPFGNYWEQRFISGRRIG